MWHGDVRAAGGGGEKGLEHGEVGEIELVKNDVRGVDTGGGEGGAHGGAGEDVVHFLVFLAFLSRLGMEVMLPRNGHFICCLDLMRILMTTRVDDDMLNVGMLDAGKTGTATPLGATPATATTTLALFFMYRIQNLPSTFRSDESRLETAETARRRCGGL